MSYTDYKDLPRRTAADKALRDKAFDIAKIPRYDGYQRDLASMVYTFFDKKTASLADKSAAGCAVKNEIMQNKELAEELHKPIIGKFEKRKVHSSLTDNSWGPDLADIQLLSKFNKEIRYCCVLMIFMINI